MLKFDQFTPEEAWQPFEAAEGEPFDRRAAVHLFRRAGFGASFVELDRAVKAGPQQTVKDLLAAPAKNEQFYSEMQRFAQSVLAGNNPESLSAWWLHVMRHAPAPLLEKTTLFWHGHFATSAAKVNTASLLYRQHELLRRHSLGSFEAMVQGIARDPAMLLYLDSATNRKTHPNENFAREVMELFCLGVGNYTEGDIQQLARCFTGWEIQYKEFKFHSYQHDFGAKTLFGRSVNFDGDDAIRVILEQPAAADFLARKLLRYFVADEAEWSDEVVSPVAKRLRATDYSIGPVVELILGSRLFFSRAARGAKVRAPVELAIGLLRSLEATASLQQLVPRLRELGQLPLYPPNVKGWNGGREWINASTILGRANLVRQLLEGETTRYASGSLEAYFAAQDMSKGSDAVAGLCELLLAVDPPQEVQDQLAAQLDRASKREAALREMTHIVASLPEFQLA
jgi:uncharacterized protein (DUF1800 family)